MVVAYFLGLTIFKRVFLMWLQKPMGGIPIQSCQEPTRSIIGFAPIKDRTLRGDGCPSCTKFGFDNNKDAWLYFLEHETWGLFQIGITNHLKNRLNDHKKLGWEVIEISNPMDGFLAKEWEKSILDFLRGSGIELGNPKIAGTYSGYTETWYKRDLQIKSIKELMRLTEEFEKDVQKNRSSICRITNDKCGTPTP